MTDIVQRLLDRAANVIIVKEKPNLYYDAAHEIEMLRANNQKLRFALIEIQCKAQDILRPIPFQDEDNE